MRAKVVIKKTFDDAKEFGKNWEKGDFRNFFEEEGEYLDKLCDTLGDKGKEGDEFTVTYTVTVVK